MSSTGDNHSRYTVGWICAITAEYVAALQFLDKEHGQPECLPLNDENDYTLGEVGGHFVVIAGLPEGRYGIASAAKVAKDMTRSFPHVRIGLMVGIGGGVPSERHDIRLGDIVISAPRDGHGGVFQYAFGKAIQDEQFETTGFLNGPPGTLLAAVNGLKARYKSDGHGLGEAVKTRLDKKPRLRAEFARPHPSSDRLYKPTVTHPQGNSGASCADVCGDDPSRLHARLERQEWEDNPAIFYGLIASADQVMKDASIRDRLAAERDVLCFEMEAAGLMNHFPCLVIRGICDYADSHKNKGWQGYAAMVASAYARDLLLRIPPNRLANEKKIGDMLSEMGTKLTAMSHSIHGQEHNAILRWLSPTDYSLQQSNNLDRWQPGTGQWFLNSPELVAWRNTDNKTLLCQGFPGAGKTIMASLVINYLQKTGQNDKIGIAFAYCDLQLWDNQTPQAILANFVKQLVQQLASVPETVKHFHDDHRGKDLSSLSIRSFLEVLQSVISCFTRVFVVVDALDECRDRRELLDSIARVQAEAGVNFLATTRPEDSIEKEMKYLFQINAPIEIRARDEDMVRYINSHLSEIPVLDEENHDLSSEERNNVIENIKSKIIQAANGVFLLARFHFNDLSDMYTLNEVLAALKSLPIGEDALAETYGKTINRIRRQKKGARVLAERVLSLLTVAKRLLTMRELRDALAVKVGASALDPGDRIGNPMAIILACAGLVAVDRVGGVVRLIHETTRTYLESHLFCIAPLPGSRHLEDPTIFDRDKNRMAIHRANGEIALVCVTYLSFAVFQNGPCENDEFQQRLTSNPLYDYAARNWGLHAHGLEASFSNATISFLESRAKVEASTQALLAHDKGHFPRQVTGLHLAAYFGLHEAVNCLLSRQHGPDPADSKGRTPLSYSAELGHGKVVQRLLETDKVDPDSKDTPRQTPLFYASKAGFGDVVKQLFDTGRVSADAENWVGRTPLSEAAENGHTKVAQYLLSTGTVDANAKCGGLFSGWTPLMFAAASGHEAIVKLLLDTDKVDADAESWGMLDAGQTPLSLAAENGYASVVKILLRTGRVDASKESAAGSFMSRPGRTALSFAAERGHDAIVDLLLDTPGVDADEPGNCGRAPLSFAAENGNETTVRLLIEKGKAEVDPRSRLGWTPLLHAARRGHTKLVKLLLGTGGVDVNAVEEQHRHTPLSFAAENGHAAIVELLLNTATIDANSRCISRVTFGTAGPDEIRTRKWYDRTPLSVAARNNHLDVVQLLLDSDAVDVDHRDSRGQTPLSLAAENGHLGVVEALLATNCVDVNSQSNPGRGPPPWAEDGPVLLAIPTSVMETGLLPGSGSYGRTPLSLAAGGGHVAVVEQLIGTTAIEVESKDTDFGRTPLSWAASGGSNDLIEMLLRTSGFEANSKDFFGRTPLSWAAGDGRESVVESLLHKGQAKADQEDYFLRTPLLWAAESGHENVVRLLLVDKVRRNAKDCECGRSPLSWAAGNGHDGAVCALLNDPDTDADCMSHEKRAPLSYAAENGHGLVVRLLLATGKVNPHVQDDEFSRTPQQWATENGHDSVAQLLQQVEEASTADSDH